MGNNKKKKYYVKKAKSKSKGNKNKKNEGFLSKHRTTRLNKPQSLFTPAESEELMYA